MRRNTPPAVRECRNSNHPAKPHGHYGFGGAHWCSDFNSPLLSEENLGDVERGWIVIYKNGDV